MVGCWSFGGDKNSYWGVQDQKEVDYIVSKALDMGVNFFDTAFMYNDGDSERSLGTALKGKRDQAVICNKILITEDTEPNSYEDKIFKSLKRLGTDYIDLMMIHWPTYNAGLLQENLLLLDKMKKKGYIRQIGVSNFGKGALSASFEVGIEPVANEFAYNLISRGIEREILPFCVSHDIGILAYMPLMQGILTGKYKSIDDMPDIRKRTYHFDSSRQKDAVHTGKGLEDDLEEFLNKLIILSENAGLTPAQAALGWLCANEGVLSVLAGIRNSAQLDENVKAMKNKMPLELLEALDDASAKIYAETGSRTDLWRDENDSRIW